jgi:hypothetical protein
MQQFAKKCGQADWGGVNVGRLGLAGCGDLNCRAKERHGTAQMVKRLIGGA